MKHERDTFALKPSPSMGEGWVGVNYSVLRRSEATLP